MTCEFSAFRVSAYMAYSRKAVRAHLAQRGATTTAGYPVDWTLPAGWVDEADDDPGRRAQASDAAAPVTDRPAEGEYGGSAEFPVLRLPEQMPAWLPYPS